MRLDVDELVSRIKSDDKYKRLYKIFSQNDLYNIPFQAWRDEVERIHKTRGIRILRQESGKFLDKVIDASIEDQANRSRLCELRLKCVRAEGALLEGVDALEEYLLLRYSSEMGAIRTKDERNKVINLALRRFQKFLKEIKTLMDMTEIVISDIDKAAFSLQRIITAFELHSKPERTL